MIKTNLNELSITPTEYWSKHMVHQKEFSSKEAAMHHFQWRCSKYMGLLDLMPVSGFDDKVVVDYGCGPGVDLMGFLNYSKPKRLIGMDISQPALDLAKKNCSLIGGELETMLLDETNNVIPMEDNSVDYIHCSGVLMCTSDLETILKEFYRILKPGGEAAVMVYNYQSIYLHLYTAWMQPVVNKKFVGLPLMEAFRANTDGEDCPISTCYKPEEFKTYCDSFGFNTKFKGAAISMLEMQLVRHRFEAINYYGLEMEQREFLSNLTFDERMVPMYDGHVAGLESCFSLSK